MQDEFDAAGIDIEIRAINKISAESGISSLSASGAPPPSGPSFGMYTRNPRRAYFLSGAPWQRQKPRL